MIFRRNKNGKPGILKKVSKDYQINRWIGYSHHKENIKKLLGVVTLNSEAHNHDNLNFEHQMELNGLTVGDITLKAKQQKTISIVLLILGISSILYLVYHAIRAEYNGVILCVLISIISLSQAITTGLTSYRLKKRSLKITLGQWLISWFR